MCPSTMGSGTIDSCCRRVVAATDLPDWELLAVNDASTDGSYERLLGLGPPGTAESASLRMDENRGPSPRPRNERGSGTPQDAWSLILDCDDEYYPDFLGAGRPAP